MPYLECPGCRLRLYSAASRSWIADDCPACGVSLVGATKVLPAGAGTRTLRREFASTPGAVARARHALDGFAGELGPDVHYDSLLLISELVTNSVTHSKASNVVIELVVCVTPSTIRVEVSDDGEGFEPPPIPHDDEESGRGLHVLQELADRWGTPNGQGTAVWFEIDRVPSHAQNGAERAAPRPARAAAPGMVA
jgi:anti-sigma regulatory factor (Ser/Thr protein kinase)